MDRNTPDATPGTARATGRGAEVLVALVPLLTLVAAWFAPPVPAWLLIMALLVLFVVVIGRPIVGVGRGALIDERNKVSLSRFQVVVWTVLGSLLSTTAGRIAALPDLSPGAVALLGISHAAYLTSKTVGGSTPTT